MLDHPLQVKKESKKGRKMDNRDDEYEDTSIPSQQTYDDVYVNSHHRHPTVHQGPRYKTSSQNTYENVKVMNLVGSLKKKLKAGKLRHIDIGEGSGQEEKTKFANGNERDNRALEQGKPVPAARNSMKKDSENKVNMVKPARGGQSKKNEPTGLTNRFSSEPEFVENELYEDRSPFDGFVYPATLQN